MIKKGIGIFILILMVTSTFAQNANKGIIIRGNYQGQGCTYEGEKGTFVLHMRNDILRYDIEFTKDSSGLIYQASSGKMWILDHSGEEYFSIDSNHMKEVKNRLNNIKERIAEYKEKMPEAALKKMLASIDISLLESYQQMEYESSKSKKKINGYKSTKYIGLVNDTIQIPQYFTTKTKVDPNSSSRKIISQLRDFTGDYLKLYFLHFPIYHFVPGPNEAFAIQTNRVVNDQSCFEYQTTQITFEMIEDDLFKIPEGYGMNSTKIPVW